MIRENYNFMGIDELLEEYKITKKHIEKAKECTVSEEKRIFTNIVSDLQFSIDWMSTGRKPGTRRGIERRAAYQREVIVNPMQDKRISEYYIKNFCSKNNQIKKHKRNKIKKALSILSKKEREIFIMFGGQNLNIKEISNYMGLSQNTIKTYIRRAKLKLKRIND